MTTYHKKTLLPAEVNEICHRYGISQLEASILCRRNIKTGGELKFFIEKDMRFSHQPFEFSGMEDAVDRINQAIDEQEKVLIFGDKDVDGIASTAILYEYLKGRGLDVSWRLPVGEDSYGLSMKAVDEFAAEFGSLIITVDCGISNNAEIEHANSLGLDVIVTDHHNPPEKLPDAIIILDPKIEGSGYPFKDISGAAVAYKLASALRLSRMDDLYAQDFCLMHLDETDGAIRLDCLKIRNMVKKESFSREFRDFPVSIYSSDLVDFLKGQVILVWNREKERKYLKALFGSSIDFQLVDMRSEISKTIPSFSTKELKDLRRQSVIAKYSDEELSDLDVFLNIFITYTEKRRDQLFPKFKNDSEKDLQLVALAAMADIMPMKDENRLFLKSAMDEINRGNARKGLKELIARSNLANRTVTSTDLSWSIVPVLNAAGRLGKSNLSLELLISDDPLERGRLSEEIFSLNEQRKTHVQEGEFITSRQAEESFESLGKKACIVWDKRIFRGITGILAGSIMKKFNVPSIALTFTEDGSVAVGSMRSCRNIKATDFLGKFGEDFFLNYGGHDAAAGFSFTADRLDSFLEKSREISLSLPLSDEDGSTEIDAELPSEKLGPEILRTLDFFEPYGEGNPKLLFMSRSLPIFDASICGKTERQHLKLTFDCASCKFPAMFWGEAERLGRDFNRGDSVDVVYNIGKNYFNGNVTAQMVLVEAKNSLKSKI